MNENEIGRIAAAVNVLRPDWPTASLRTLLKRAELANRPRRDVAVALTWVACESESKTPARVLEQGPWWQAAAVDALSNGHHHAAKVYGWNEGDPRQVCGICGLDRTDCQRRATKSDDHEFVPRTRCLPPIERGHVDRRALFACGAAVIDGTTCNLRAGHSGDHAMSTKEGRMTDHTARTTHPAQESA